MPRPAGFLVAGLTLLVPWVTWILGRAPNYHQAINETALLAFSTGMLVVLGAVVLTQEPCLGGFVIYMALRSLWTATPFAFETAQAVAFVALGIVSIRSLPRRWAGVLSGLLAGSAALQVLVAVLQEQGYYPLWIGWERIPAGWTHGTLGNPNHLGTLLALTVAFAPAWALPVWGLGLVLSRSILAALAAAVALSVRFRRMRIRVAVASLVVLALVVWLRGTELTSWQDRVTISQVALQGWSFAPLFGHGPGSWASIGPALQSAPEAVALFHKAGTWQEVHNEAVQLLFEGGIVAMGLLAAWVWQRRARLNRSPAILALGILNLGSFPFHVPALMVTAMAVLGLALTEEKEAPCQRTI